MLDRIDTQILKLLQKNPEHSIESISAKVGLSRTACWNRLQKMQHNKLLKGKSLDLDYAKLGYSIKALVLIKTNSHEKGWLEKFSLRVQELANVIHFYRLTGEVDYVLEIVCKDMQDYNQIYKKLIDGCSIYSVSTAIVMEEQAKPMPLPDVV